MAGSRCVVGLTTGTGSVFSITRAGSCDPALLTLIIVFRAFEKTRKRGLGYFLPITSQDRHLHFCKKKHAVDSDGNLGTIDDRGGLVFERAYNSLTTTVDAWLFEMITDSTYLWNFGTLLGSGANINASPYAYDATLAEWKSFFPNAAIIGFSSGIGSGWGAFSGAVDNIGFTINGVTTSANFETQAAAAVPEPASLALLTVGLFGICAVRRRSRSR